MSSVESTTPQNNETTTPVDSNPLEGEALKQAILKQVEFYFSTQNLPSDSYLLSKMDQEHYVPISLIANFGKIKELTLDQSLLVEAIQMSTSIELSEDKSKLRLKEEKRRNRLILHNLPSETTDQDLKEVFAKGDFAPEIKSDVNNCWFVTFATEEKAAAGLEFIRSQKIHDKSIRARLKPEPLLRNIYTPSNPNPAQYIQNPTAVYGMGYGQSWAPIMYYDQNGELLKGVEGKDRRYKGKPQRNKDYKGKSDSNKKRNQRKGKGRENKKQPPVQLGPSDFPPLPSSSSGKSVGGYSGEFKQYTQEEIIQTLDKIVPVKPDNANEFPFVEEANTTLETASKVVIESKDLSASSRPVTMSERVKKSKNAAQPSKSSKDKPSKSDSSAKKTKEVQPATPAPIQPNAKGSWSQIAKSSTPKKPLTTE